jgi:DNA-binding IclR family transcriptional regulator
VPPSQRNPTRIQSLARANKILDVLVANGVAALRDISEATGLNKTTVYYLTESLVDLGFAERVGDGQGYRLGLRNLELGRTVLRRVNIIAVSRPSLIRLCALSRETVNLALPYVFDAMIVESLEGTHGVRATSYAGSRAPYHATACGKAILAFLEPAVRESIYQARPLNRITPKTITEKDALEAQLAVVKARGYAIDMEETELNAHCVAAPIWDGLGNVAGAISVAALASRLSQSALTDLAQSIMRETNSISKILSGELAMTRGPTVEAGRSPRRQLRAR